ncbi:hypothetical protein BDV09DRAFT_174874 [Aspergillus tetrazonus]
MNPLGQTFLMTYTINCPIHCGKRIWWDCVERSRQVVNNVLDIFCTPRQTNQVLHQRSASTESRLYAGSQMYLLTPASKQSC